MRTTPAQQHGLVVGDWISADGYNMPLQFDNDDGTTNPYFRDHEGVLYCPNLNAPWAIISRPPPLDGPAPAEPVPDQDETPAQMHNLSEGDEILHDGRIWTLTLDDNSTCPYFEDSDGEEKCIDFYADDWEYLDHTPRGPTLRAWVQANREQPCETPSNPSALSPA